MSANPSFPESKKEIQPGTKVEVITPGQPTFYLIVQHIIGSSTFGTPQIGSQPSIPDPAPDVAVCIVHRSDYPTINSILKIIFDAAKFKKEAHLCRIVSDAWLKSPTPYVVKFYGFLDLKSAPPNPDPNHPKVAIGGIHMKYYPLGTIFDGLYKKNNVCQLPEATLKPIFKSILVGLHFLHTKAKIAHRDIKFENIFLLKEPNGTVGVIADFGASMPQDDPQHQIMSVIKGREFFYTAPEARRMIPYDHKCDIWSLGTLFYIMLHGIDPTGEFTVKNDMYGSDGAGIAWKTNYKPDPTFGTVDTVLRFPTVTPEVSLNLRHLLQKMTEFNPNSRPTAEAILSDPYFSNDGSLAWIK